MYKIIKEISAIGLLIANDVVLLDKAIFGRKIKWQPFSKLWISWYPKPDSHGKMQWAPLLNVFMLSPMLFLLCIIFPRFFEKKGVLKGMIIAFFSSLFIETSQAITCLGTFQISDLVYNTLSGIIGVLAYKAILKVCTLRFFGKAEINNQQFI